MVTDVTGPDVGFTARMLPSACMVPTTETIAFGVSVPSVLLPLYCVFEFTSIVLGRPYGPCIRNEFPDVFTETRLPVKSVIWPTSLEAETADTLITGLITPV